ncbi:hypothetical protein DTO271G3_8748 [Paecilomyces variotii]|nr:hypothetical protein DTO271G3_8748 [Paecilomyces variotii]
MMLFTNLFVLSLGWSFLPILVVGAPSNINNINNNDGATAPPNSNHIFNAIYASMRHRASSLYPNGVSFFLATVPKGTQFYHGSGNSTPVTGVEWLAFEPEHALGFAHRSGQHGHPHFPIQDQDQGQRGGYDAHTGKNAAQRPLGSDEDDDGETAGGYLHTYVTARDLRLLYLDGESGMRGHALDAQDRILFNDTIGGRRSRMMRETGLGGPPDEQERAILACKMVKEVWNDRVDGLIRTEADFEIILCNFERDLEVEYITRTMPQKGREHREKSSREKEWRQKDHGEEEGKGPRDEKRHRKHKSDAPSTEHEHQGKLCQEKEWHQHDNGRGEGKGHREDKQQRKHQFDTPSTEHEHQGKSPREKEWQQNDDGRGHGKDHREDKQQQKHKFDTPSSDREHQGKFSREKHGQQMDHRKGEDPERRHGPKHKDHGREGRPRYNDLAGHRVIIDFEHFVTAYTYDLDLFPNNSTLPRLDHLSTEELQPIREDITHMILTQDPSRHAFDWQSVVDMIMAEYSEELRRLAKGHFPSVAVLREELERKLEPFIDYSDIGDWESVTYRCQERFIPKHVANDTVVVRVVRDISHEICSAMTSVLADSEIDKKTAGGVFQQLVEYLAWPAERHGPR